MLKCKHLLLQCKYVLLQYKHLLLHSLIQSRPCPPDGGVDNGVTHVSAVDLKNVVEVTWSPGDDGVVEGVYFV